MVGGFGWFTVLRWVGWIVFYCFRDFFNFVFNKILFGFAGKGEAECFGFGFGVWFF